MATKDVFLAVLRGRLWTVFDKLCVLFSYGRRREIISLTFNSLGIKGLQREPVFSLEMATMLHRSAVFILVMLRKHQLCAPRLFLQHLDHIASYILRWLMNGEVKIIGKEAFKTSIKTLSSHSPAVTEENQDKFKMALLWVHFVNFMQKTHSKYNLSITYDKATLRALKIRLISLWIYLN
jgi:hypothetical protein